MKHAAPPVYHVDELGEHDFPHDEPGERTGITR
ncbi:hypothetical protein MB901379_02173 [Mycobacterium basiliense]|uniref:Uncharacterized protein n=1 Tax=Mycobacterium basiliense TaxID=2094119 RepID=A0A447GDP5_9MYCO|nr:hypothetical protein MB901379_02173 [Mycobacterium basiliense]